MSISPISPIRPVAVPTLDSLTATKESGSGGSSFGDVLSKQFDAVSVAQDKADRLAVEAATGDLQSLQDYTIASTEAQLLTQVTVAVRNKAVEAFNEIMRMQI
jgi:flagellar hook-basal body complex protein FliE